MGRIAGFIDMESMPIHTEDLPCFAEIAQAQEFLYLLRNTLNGKGVILYGKMPTGHCFRRCRLHYLEDTYLVNDETVPVAVKILSEAQPANQPGAREVQVLPADTEYVLFDEIITRKTFDRLMMKMKVRMSLPQDVLSWVSKNHSDLVGVRVVGSEDRWIAETRAISQLSREMIDVLLHVSGGERFRALTIS